MSILTSCETKQFKGARVAVDFPEADSLVAKIYHYPILEEEVLAQFDLDTANRGVLQLELSKPLMLYIKINGSKRYDLFLKPGYDLKLSKDTTGVDDSIFFEGEGARINNYINHISSLLFTEDVINYDLSTFKKKYDSLNVALEDFSRSYFDRFPMKKDDLELLQEIKKMKQLSLKTIYAYRAHNTALIDQVFKFQDGEDVVEIDMLNDLQSFFSDIPFDTAHLKNGMFGYKTVLYDYLLEMHNRVFDPKLWDGANRQWPIQVSARWPRQVNNLLKEESCPNGIKEYLMANDLRHWMDSQGITPEIDSIFNEFKLEFQGSIYKKTLQKIYDKKVAILRGSIAPDFSGTTLQGGVISLTEFKGKVVYVDVWATWCGPCLEEIPYAKILQDDFQESKIVFLNVSIDRSPEAWKKMLIKEKDWLGTHIILDRQEHDTFSKNYKVVGIPKYLLIDQTGKIFSANASRPSSSTIKDEINSLLH